jgi:thioredoxin 1
MSLLNLTDKNFDDEIKKAGLPVLVDFWASWCGPCRIISPVLEELAKEYEGKLRVVKLNIDDNRLIPSRYMIMSIPTLLFFKNGQITKQVSGSFNKSQLKKLIEENL